MHGWDARIFGVVRILMAAAWMGRSDAWMGRSDPHDCRERGSSAFTGPTTSLPDDPQGASTAKTSSALWLLTSDKDSPDSRHVEPPEMGDVLALACEHVRYESTVGARRRLR